MPTVALNTPTPIPIPPTPAPPTPTPTPIPNPCPEQQNLMPPEKQTLEQQPEAVRKYLALGGNPENIELVDWEGYLSADLTGDLIPEYIYVFIDITSSYYPPLSTLVIYQCSEETVNILEVFEPEDWWGLELINTKDMTQNGNTDLIFSEVTCGAHTCWHTLHVLTWTGTEFTDSVGGELSYPFAEYYFVDDQFLIGSSGIGSAGAGPQRPITATIAWDGSVITSTMTTIGPAFLRFHAFVDGDTALNVGQYSNAYNHYLRVIEDMNLQSWGAVYQEDEENEWLRVLAHWRLINLNILQNDPDTAEIYYDALKESTSLDTPAFPVVLLSDRFWQSIKAGNDLNHACSVVRAMPETVLIRDFLNSFGYANPHYKADDLCISLIE
jgi:hypothetical protein